MKTRPLAFLLFIALLLGACSSSSQSSDSAATKPTPSATASVLETTPTATTQPPRPQAQGTTPCACESTATATSTQLAKVRATGSVPTSTPTARHPKPTSTPGKKREVATAETTPTSVPPKPTATEPYPNDFTPSKQAQDFAVKFQNAIFSLEKLPGYTYSVNVPLFAPGLTLKGNVASPGTRSWTVHEQGAPKHVVARWVRMGGKAYTDASGKWEQIDSVPFDTDYPISFSKGYVASFLFEPYGNIKKYTHKDAVIDSQAAVRYDLEINFADSGSSVSDSAQDEAPSFRMVYSLWIAKKGGYLLRYTQATSLDNTRSTEQSISVTALSKPTGIRTPKVGSPVFTGNPPPWRVKYLAHQRLKTLKSYRFEVQQNTGGPKLSARGQVSAKKGRLSGEVLDLTSYIDPSNDENPSTAPLTPAENLKTVKAQLVYVGDKIWTRSDGGKWVRVTPITMDSLPQTYAAQMLLTLAPGDLPKSVLSKQYGMGLAFDESMFGIDLTASGQPMVLANGKFVGTEKVNGVRTLHYKGNVITDDFTGFSSGYATGQLAPGDSKGTEDVWIAADGWYLVRSRASLPGAPDVSPGRALRIDVYDANQPFSVKLPDDNDS